MIHKNKINKLMKSGVPLLTRLESCLYLNVIPSLDCKGWYVVSTYTSRYYEDNGEYDKRIDTWFSVDSTRKLRSELKKRYYGGEIK